MTPVSQFRAHHQWLRTASADTVGVCEKSLFCVIAPSTTFRSGSFRGPRRAHSASLAGQGHWGYEGTWVVAGGEMSCGFWGQILQHSDGTELPEALYNLPRQLSPFPKAYPGKQGQLPAAHPLLQISPKSASGRS